MTMTSQMWWWGETGIRWETRDERRQEEEEDWRVVSWCLRE